MNKNLFWFLKNRSKLEINHPSELDTYVQQVITRGKTSDIKELLKTVKPSQFKESFHRLKPFLPLEVKKFWEDFIGSTHSATKRTA